MADFPTLAEFVERHADLWIIGNSSYRTCTCGGWKDTALSAQFSRASFGAHVQAEWVKDRTIETVAQLDALPVRSVVRDADGDVPSLGEPICDNLADLLHRAADVLFASDAHCPALIAELRTRADRFAAVESVIGYGRGTAGE